MITIIIVSVLSTLGVVAVVGSVVIAFKRLSKKVDVINLELITNDVYKDMEINKKELMDEISDIHRLIEQHSEEIWRKIDDNQMEIQRTIDSRCDKLDAKITNSVPKNRL